MDGSATTAEQRALGLRLMAIGDRLVRRAESAAVFVVDGAVESRSTSW